MKLGWLCALLLFLPVTNTHSEPVLRSPAVFLSGISQSVKIKNKLYKVEVTKKLAEVGLQGLFISYPPIIQVFPDEELEMSFFHELLHGWSHEYNTKPELTEKQVRTLEKAIFITFLQNNWAICNASSVHP